MEPKNNLLGSQAIKEIPRKHIAIIGMTEVACYALSALIEEGFRKFTLIGEQTFDPKECRWYGFERKTKKTEGFKRRLSALDSQAELTVYDWNPTAEKLLEIDVSKWDYVLDCCEDMLARTTLILKAKEAGVCVLSVLDFYNCAQISALQIKDFTKIPSASQNKEWFSLLRKNGIQNVKVLYSSENPISTDQKERFSFVDMAAGALIAREILLDFRKRWLAHRVNLVLEGGGMKGVYTAGVLDFFLDHFVEFNEIYAVSAGACTACSFISKQKGRGYHSMVDYLGNPNYASKRSLTKTGNYFNKDFVYNKIPNELLPFDYQTANQNPTKLYATVTNVETGSAEYLKCEDYYIHTEYVCASSSLPLLSEIQFIDEKGYLDGGIVDSIPFEEARKNAAKCVVVLTKPAGYVCKKQNAILLQAMKLKYKKYPKFLQAIQNRHIVYNRTLSCIEKSKDAFTIRPSKNLEIDRLETNKNKLKALYRLGYQDASDSFEALKNFLNDSDF